MTTPRPAPDAAQVTVLLVSHEGARWLPAVLDGLVAQTRAPDHCVAVDTGSTDGSADLIAQRLGERLTGEVRIAPATTAYGAAVALGLDGVDDPQGWVWLLHDDSAPAPDALERLLEAAEANPSADLLGPKLREWPSLRRLLEVGVTISGTGRRETGLERGEYDQGQHDRVRDVLAVNTAGLLVRRQVLDELGLDPRLPLFGNDLDLGWRAARAGHRTIVAPAAVVFHVEAAHRGVRAAALTGTAHRRGERAAALYTLLANCSARALPFAVLRLLVGGLARVVGLLLVRAPGEARDELLALASVYARPGRIVAGRRDRRRTARVRPREVRHLLAPAWMPYRHGLDLVSDLGSALLHQAADLSAARRARPDGRERLAGSETGPVPAEAQNLPEDSGLLARLVLSPVAWVFATLLVAALVAARGMLGAGFLTGGALLPAPASSLDWWGRYLESWHDLGTGSGAPAAPYLVPLAAAGTLLLGKAWLVLDLLFLLAVPLAAFGAYRFLVRTTGSLPASLWGAAAYGVLPVVSGAVQQGRLGTVAGALVLPWLAHAALFLSSAHDRDRRARAAWRCALWLALLTAFVPVAWFVALVVAVLAGAVVLVGRASARGGPVVASSVTAVATALVATLVLLLPWTLAVWAHQGLAGVLFEAGLPARGLAEPLSRWDVLTGRPGGGAPGWLSVGVLVAAVAALVRPDTRRTVVRSWVVLVSALLVVAVLAPLRTSLPASPVDQPLWLGFPLLVAQAAAIAAAAFAGAGIRSRLTGSSFGWRQPVGGAVVLLAAVTPLVCAGWWAWTGSGGPLDRREPSRVPAYMTDAAAADPVRGVLVVRGSRASGFDHQLLRQPGLRVGDDTALPSAADQARLTAYVQQLAGAPQPSDVAGLARLGVAYVYVPPPADVGLVGNLDSVSGVTAGSALTPGARAWQLEAAPSRADLTEPDEAARPWLLGLQGVALLVVGVLAAPTRKEQR